MVISEHKQLRSLINVIPRQADAINYVSVCGTTEYGSDAGSVNLFLENGVDVMFHAAFRPRTQV